MAPAKPALELGFSDRLLAIFDKRRLAPARAASPPFTPQTTDDAPGCA